MTFMRFLAAILLFCFAIHLEAIVLLPTPAEETAYGSWEATANAMNAQQLGTNAPGTTDFGGSPYIMVGTGTGLGCAISSNKIAFASHIGNATSWRYYSDAAGVVTYTATSFASDPADFTIATVDGVLPVYAPINTNNMVGSNLIAWGRGKIFDPTGTPSGSPGARTFPIVFDPVDPDRLHWAPVNVSQNSGLVAGGALVFAGVTYRGAATFGDSSGPLFKVNPTTGRSEFVGNWYGSEAAGSTVSDGNQSVLNTTWRRAGFIASNVSDMSGSPTNAPTAARGTINVGTFIFGP